MKKKILYSILLLFTFWLFAEGIPVTMYDRYSTFFSLVGAVAVAVFATATLFRFLPKPDPEKEMEGDNSGYLIFGVILISLFGSGIFFVSHGLNRRERDIEDNKKFAIATIVDGSSFKSRRIDDTSIIVKFKLEDGKDYSAEIEVTASQFSQFSLDQQIPIIYSSVHPSLAKIAIQ